MNEQELRAQVVGLQRALNEMEKTLKEALGPDGPKEHRFRKQRDDAIKARDELTRQLFSVQGELGVLRARVVELNRVPDEEAVREDERAKVIETLFADEQARERARMALNTRAFTRTAIELANTRQQLEQAKDAIRALVTRDRDTIFPSWVRHLLATIKKEQRGKVQTSLSSNDHQPVSSGHPRNGRDVEEARPRYVPPAERAAPAGDAGPHSAVHAGLRRPERPGEEGLRDMDVES